MIKKSSFSHASFIPLGTYIVAPSVSSLSSQLREEMHRAEHASDSLFLCIDDGIPSSRHESLLSELSSIYNVIKVYHIEGGEGAKTWESLERLIGEAFSQGVCPSWHIAAVGGGAVLDVVSFFSSIYMRGCPLILFPSTLLSMTDAALGGKNGINFKGIKNFIGTVSFPFFVYSSVDFLEDISSTDILHGTAEMWKHACLHSEKAHAQFIQFFSHLYNRGLCGKKLMPQEWIEEIFFNIQTKMAIVSQSLTTPEKRHLLNLGHTVAHALEAATEGAMPHSIAVFYGIIAEAYIGKEMGIVESMFYDQLEGFFSAHVSSALGWNGSVNEALFKMAMKRDKKNTSDKPAIVVLRTFGEPYEESLGVYRRTLSENQIELAVHFLKEVMGRHTVWR